MTEMIGRMAGAISEANSQWEKENNCLALAGVEPQLRWGEDYLTTLATAVLAAMKPPTSKMIDAGADPESDGLWTTPANVWELMIDAELPAAGGPITEDRAI